MDILVGRVVFVLNCLRNLVENVAFIVSGARDGGNICSGHRERLERELQYKCAPIQCAMEAEQSNSPAIQKRIAWSG